MPHKAADRVESGALLARVADDAFMGGMSAAMVIAAVVVAVASAALFAFLPARAAAHEPPQLSDMSRELVAAAD